MALTILYFAWVRERMGADTEQVNPPKDVETVGELIAWLAKRGPAYRRAFAEPDRIRAAVDQAFAPFDAPITGAREVAFFPPVTGG